jgi:hypothetical protein
LLNLIFWREKNTKKYRERERERGGEEEEEEEEGLKTNFNYF